MPHRQDFCVSKKAPQECHMCFIHVCYIHFWCIQCFVLDSARNLKSFLKTWSGDAWIWIESCHTCFMHVCYIHFWRIQCFVLDSINTPVQKHRYFFDNGIHCQKKSIWCILCFVLDSTRNLKSFWKTRSEDAWLRIQDTLVQITSIRYCQIIVWHKIIVSLLSNNICFVKQYLFSTAVLLCQRLSV